MYQHILLAVDLNEESSLQKALTTAVRLAESFGAQLHVVTVIPEFKMTAVAAYFPKGYLKKACEEATGQLHALTSQRVPPGVAVQHIVTTGTIYREILATAAEVSADLIVMASHRPDLSDYLLGPNAARVVRHANCSVMVVRN